MRVKDVMNTQLHCCGPDTNLAEATAILWSNDCGALPVTEDGKVSGMLTDRDICIALGTSNRPASEVLVKEVAAHDLKTCQADDDLHVALAMMSRAQVHRLPVLDREGRLVGIVAMNDLALAAHPKRGAVTNDEVMTAIQALSRHRSAKTAGEQMKLPPVVAAVA